MQIHTYTKILTYTAAYMYMRLFDVPVLFLLLFAEEG